MHLEAVIVGTGRSTWRPQSSVCRDALTGRDRVERVNALGGRDGTGLEMHLAAEIDLNPEMQLEAEIEQVWRCIWKYIWSWIWRPRSSNSEMFLEAVIEQV